MFQYKLWCEAQQTPPPAAPYRGRGNNYFTVTQFFKCNMYMHTVFIQGHATTTKIFHAVNTK